QFEGAREGAREGRLAEARDALEQRVPAGDQADQRAAHGLGLADHDAADGGLDLCGDALELLRRERLELPGRRDRGGIRSHRLVTLVNRLRLIGRRHPGSWKTNNRAGRSGAVPWASTRAPPAAIAMYWTPSIS